MSFFGSIKTFFEHVGLEFEKLFGKASKFEQTLQAVVSYVAPIVSVIVTVVDPAIAPLVNRVIAIVEADLATLSSIAKTAAIAPGTSAVQTVAAALNSIQSNLSGLLQMAEVKNDAKAAHVTALATSVIQEVEAVLASLPK